MLKFHIEEIHSKIRLMAYICHISLDVMGEKNFINPKIMRINPRNPIISILNTKKLRRAKIKIKNKTSLVEEKIM